MVTKLNTKEINSLREQLIKLNAAYRMGKPQISDIEYDKLVEKLWQNNPKDKFFEKGIVEKAEDRMEKLPVPMFSLEKVKTLKELRKWLQKMSDAGCKTVIITPKFDGISLVVDESVNDAWTRGDGVMGQKSSLHYKRMNKPIPRSEDVPLYTWGEAILAKRTFTYLKKKCRDFNYKNARNMVAGLFNSPDGYKSSFIDFVDFIRYGCDEFHLNKNVQLLKMKNAYGKEFVADWKIYFISTLLGLKDIELNSFLNEDLYNVFNDKYKIDGIVIEVDEAKVRFEIGRLNNGNPGYAIAFKREEWCDVYQTTVKSIEYGIGKTGVLNPVIVIDPVEMDGATVSRATAYNAKTLIERNICPGAIIEIIRSGDVIPKHLKTISFDSIEMQQQVKSMQVCPSCGEILEWDETETNLLCKNSDCKERVISELVYFFRTMGCEEFEEPSLRKLYENGYTYYTDIIDLSCKELQQILGKSRGETVYQQIQKFLIGGEGVPLARYLTALNIFDGKIGETICQKILDNSDEFGEEKNGMFVLKRLTVDRLICLIANIPGIGEKFARAFINGINQFCLCPLIQISYIKSPKIEVTDGEKMFVCMTGFRSKELEQALTSKGHTVLNGVTKACTVLVVADLNSTSSKMKTAKQLGIRIVDRKTFEDEILPKG